MTTFYSLNTGNWEDGANWSLTSHTGSAQASPGVKGTDWPGSGNTAVISAGHTITVTTDLHAEASPILLNCDTPGTNTGTLKFSPTATTGLNARLNTIAASTTFNVYMGTRLAPIQRGNTCTLTTGSGAFAISASATLNFQAWGQHREASTTDIYCDLLTVAANKGDSSITLSGDMLPTLAANNWLFLSEQSTDANAIASAELVQVTSYNSGSKVAVLNTPLKYSYTTTHAYVFRVKDHIVNTLLSEDHTSGANYVLKDDLYPAGTAGGTFLVCRSNTATKTGTVNPTVSSYNSGTKTLTATASSSTSQSTDSIVLMDDFNIRITGGNSFGNVIGSSGGTPTAVNQIMAYTAFDTWAAVNSAAQSMILVNCNLFNCLSFNNDSLTGYRMLMYGVGCGQKTGASLEARVMLRGTNGGQIIKCLLSQSADSSSNGYGSMQNCYFEDSMLMPGLFGTLSNCYFNRCGIGNQDQLNVTNMNNVYGNQFTGCFFFGMSNSSSTVFSYYSTDRYYQNNFNDCVFGETPNGKVLVNNMNFKIGGGPLSLLLNGVRLSTGEPNPSFIVATNPYTPFTSVVKMAMNGLVTNQFRNLTPGGKVEQDTSGYRSSAPSIKFTHSASADPVWFDIPCFLNSGSRTLTIYTNPSTGTWSDAPQMLLLPEYAADILAREWVILPYLAEVIQTTLTTGTYSSLQLTKTIATSGIYIIRLWARNGSGTLNWDDFSVA